MLGPWKVVYTLPVGPPPTVFFLIILNLIFPSYWITGKRSGVFGWGGGGGE